MRVSWVLVKSIPTKQQLSAWEVQPYKTTTNHKYVWAECLISPAECLRSPALQNNNWVLEKSSPTKQQLITSTCELSAWEVQPYKKQQQLSAWEVQPYKTTTNHKYVWAECLRSPALQNNNWSLLRVIWVLEKSTPTVQNTRRLPAVSQLLQIRNDSSVLVRPVCACLRRVCEALCLALIRCWLGQARPVGQKCYKIS